MMRPTSGAVRTAPRGAGAGSAGIGHLRGRCRPGDGRHDRRLEHHRGRDARPGPVRGRAGPCRAGVELPLAIVLGGGYGANAWRYTARFLGWLVLGRVWSRRPTRTCSSAEPRNCIGCCGRARGGCPPPRTGRSRRRTWRPSCRARPRRGGCSAGIPRRASSSCSSASASWARCAPSGSTSADRGARFSPRGLATPCGSIGDGERTELLMEVRFRRDQTRLPGMEVLYLEWLLLQNPRRDFACGKHVHPRPEAPRARPAP